MTYAPATRAFYDADSHIMELPDFLKKYADPELRDEIPAVSYSASDRHRRGGGGDRRARAVAIAPEHVAAQIALGDRLIEVLEGDPGAGRLRRRRPVDGAGPAGFQPAAGVRHPQRGHAVLAQHQARAAPALRRGPGPQPAHGRLLPRRRAADGRGGRAARRPGAGDGRAGIRAGERPRGGLGPAPALRRTLARATSTSTRSGRGWPRAARRSCCTSAARRCSWPRPG